MVTTKSALFGAGSNIEKQLCFIVRPVIINEDCILVIVAKYTTLSKSTKKWSLRYHCHEKTCPLIAWLSCLKLVVVWNCVCLSECTVIFNVHVYSWKKIFVWPKIIIISWRSFTKILMLRKARQISTCGRDFVLHLMKRDENAKYSYRFK